MKVTGGSGAVLAVVGFILGWMMLAVSPAAANPDEDSSGDSSGGCPKGGCVYKPEETGGSQKQLNPPHGDTSGSSSSGSSGGHTSSSGSSGSHSKDSDKDSEKPKAKEPEPEVIVRRDPTPRLAPVQPQQRAPQPQQRAPQPRTQTDAGGPFVVQAPSPTPQPVLDVAPVSVAVPLRDPPAGTGPSGPGTDDGSTSWALIPALVTAAAGAALALAPGRRPDNGGYAGPAGRFAQAALGGAVSAGPPAAAKPPVDVKQVLWDWGGHVLGGAVTLIGAASTPVSGPIIAAGIAIAALSELKRRYWPSKPLRVDDVVGNPYEDMQKAGDAGLGETMRKRGNAALSVEPGLTDNVTTTWAESSQQVHKETGGKTQSFGEARRDAIK